MTEDETRRTTKVSSKIELINAIFKIVIISSITGTVLYKVITFSLDITKFDLTKFDFSDLLSLILAIFSIGLSVMFYIKADETSNRFYDNTQKFTRDISEILGRIEAGFGEKLRHIDEGYNKLEGYYKNSKPETITKKEIEKNEAVVIEAEEQKNTMIQELVKKSRLDATEKKAILEKLDMTNRDLEKTRLELSRLRTHQLLNSKSSESNDALITAVDKYFLQTFSDNPKLSKTKKLSEFRNIFDSLYENEHPEWISDLEKLGFLHQNGGVSFTGARHFMELLQEKS